MIGTLSPDMGHTGINRNIVECKFNTWDNGNIDKVELIETLWNVNLLLDIISQHKAIELIETLWNVNTLTLRRFSLTNKAELIETLWNVNEVLRELEEMVDKN